MSFLGYIFSFYQTWGNGGKLQNDICLFVRFSHNKSAWKIKQKKKFIETYFYYYILMILCLICGQNNYMVITSLVLFVFCINNDAFQRTNKQVNDHYSDAIFTYVQQQQQEKLNWNKNKQTNFLLIIFRFLWKKKFWVIFSGW